MFKFKNMFLSGGSLSINITNRKQDRNDQKDAQIVIDTKITFQDPAPLLHLSSTKKLSLSIYKFQLNSDLHQVDLGMLQTSIK